MAVYIKHLSNVMLSESTYILILFLKEVTIVHPGNKQLLLSV